MPSQSNLILFGAAGLDSEVTPEFQSDEKARKLLELLKSNGVTHLDSAQLYGQGKSEAAIGRIKALDKGFTVDTKWLGGWTGQPWASRENIVSSAKDSLEKLGASKGLPVDVFYLHSPDTKTPFSETLQGVNEAYQNGGFTRFGLSNFSIDQTKEVLEICEKNGYVKPTVYQGNYSAAARKLEDELLPLIRKHNMAFYAYSPVAGGFLTKDRKFVEDQQGRFAGDAIAGIYHKMYRQDNFLTFLDDWGKLAEEEGISKPELAFRWVNYHSALEPSRGDGIIFGASKFSQVEATTKFLSNGPLSDFAAKKIDELWDRVKNDSIMDNFVAVFGGGA